MKEGKGLLLLAIIALLLSVLLAAADQLLKMLVVVYVKPVGEKPLIGGLLDLEYVENRGAAFSILQNQRWFFVAVTVALCVLIVALMFRYESQSAFSWAASVLILGGGLGNLADRLARGYVVDYIHVSFFPAIFNFGDACVTVGAVFFLIHVFFFADRDRGAEKVLRMK